MSPKNPFTSVGEGCSWLRSILIFVKGSEKKISVELPLSTRILRVVKLATNNVTTSASSWGIGSTHNLRYQMIWQSPSNFCLLWGPLYREYFFIFGLVNIAFMLGDVGLLPVNPPNIVWISLKGASTMAGFL